jgi:ribosomal protein S18 acetylase RimI-like enzyme
MAITFRDIQAGDESFLLDLYASTRAQEMALVPWTDEQQRAFIKMQFAAQDADYRERFPDADYRVILQDEEAVGRMYVLRNRQGIRILDITILPRFRNAGIGTSLIQTLIAEGAETKRSVQIYVESFNPSLRLFERLGFSVIEEDGFIRLLEWRAAA